VVAGATSSSGSGTGACSGVPQSVQNISPGMFSVPQAGQMLAAPGAAADMDVTGAAAVIAAVGGCTALVRPGSNFAPHWSQNMASS
jgi:hypothetical protein